MWFSPCCQEVVRSAWQAIAYKDPEFVEKSKNEDRIAAKQHGHFDEATRRDVQNLMQQLEEYKSNENMMWQQRSKVHWLYDRDRSTKFFHATATSRKKYNTIWRIKDVGGNWREDPEGVQEVLLDYFCNIFASSSPSDQLLEEILNTVRPKSAFIPSRLITDNVLVTFELNHFIRQRVRGKEAERMGDTIGISISREAPRTSQLLFADNTIIFGEAREESMSAIKRVLKVFGQASGQEVNFEKSSIVISRNISEVERHGYRYHWSDIGYEAREIFGFVGGGGEIQKVDFLRN
ncbi:hypothetical protein Sango_2306800 [Sesamum angolense]|uniref:Reverse transcriptase domain-containing protein n=1 Tax=Sesamum angolense TaxID=2727404 RepID=A0AAE1WAF5_9LAMI|nr:hypothetical protein Sango_2306800 [Sesamum angolense]